MPCVCVHACVKKITKDYKKKITKKITKDYIKRYIQKITQRAKYYKKERLRKRDYEKKMDIANTIQCPVFGVIDQIGNIQCNWKYPM